MKSFTFFDDYYRVAKRIRSKKARQEFVIAVIEYAFEGIEPTFSTEAAEIAFEGVFRSINKQRTKSSNAKSNDNQTTIKTESNPNQNQIKEESKSDKYNLEISYISDLNISSKGGGSGGRDDKFLPPSPDEVATFAQSYAQKIDYSLGDFSPDDFCDFYASKGWMVGKNPMKDWKRACQKWVREHGSPLEVSEYAAYDQGAETIAV